MMESLDHERQTEFSIISDEHKRAYNKDGFTIIRSLFDGDEVDLLRRYAEKDLSPEAVITKGDSKGNTVSLKMWDRPGDDIYGMFSRNQRIVDGVEFLLNEAVYLYSAKMILKNARDGGAWEWHQDYGYWYNYGCLSPSMLSCLIAVDRATKENGCLQILSGSHLIGRINHDRINEQTVADTERVEVATKRFELIHLEMEPGDAVFFHCNLLHRSDENKSEHRRWNFICSYNAVSNQPYKRVREYGNYEELRKVSRSAIKRFGALS